MTISVNIDESLKDRTPEYVEGISSHMQNNIPFMIYYSEDEKYNLIAFPAERRVICYSGGAASTNEVCHSTEAFLHRIKFAIPVYDKFKSLKPQPRITESKKVTVAVHEKWLNNE